MKPRALIGLPFPRAVILIIAMSQAQAGEASFASKPAVAKEGDRVKISFGVSAPTDVEVAVVDASGKVVRHLAAGMLGGKNPPPEPLKSGLSQELIWDGKDDFGRTTSGACKVRVRAGMQLKLGALLATDPLYVCYPQSMATDGDGNLYFLSGSTASVTDASTDCASLRVFSRKGEYVRTILPMPGDLPMEKAKLFEVIQTGEKSWAPRNRCATWPEFYRKNELCGGASWKMANRVGKDGVLNLCNNGSLLRLLRDGSPSGPEVQPALVVPGKKPGAWAPIGMYFNTAVSPDGARIYVSGLNGGAWKQKRNDPDYPAGRILAIEGKTSRTFIDVTLGDKGPAPQPRSNACDLEGMSCDASGNLYVCDPTNARVCVFTPDGKESGSFSVENPMQVACHRKTGEVYVLCVAFGYTKSKKTLKKFSSYKDGFKELASFSLAETGEDGCMALDDSAEPPVVWAATRAGNMQFTFFAPAKVYRLEDKGSAFVETPHPITFELDGVKERLAVHPETDLVIYRGQYSEAGAVNGLTGEKVALPFKNCIDMAAGQDGNWYIHATASFSGFICKYDKDLKPIATADSKLPAASNPPANAVGYSFGKYGWGISASGLAADKNGRLLAHGLGNGHVDAGYFVIGYGPDGKVEDHPWGKDSPSFQVQQKDSGYKFFNSAVVVLSSHGGGLQLDLQGNIYVGDMVWPVDPKAPPGYEKESTYFSVVGSVVKYSREGGQCTDISGEPPAGKKGLVIQRERWPRSKVFAENAQAIYPGLGVFAGSLGAGCACRHPTFAVDGFGRLAIPNAMTFKVRLVDNAGNEIVEFGKYGNIDTIVEALKAAQASLAATDPLRKLEITPSKPQNINALLKAKPLPVSETCFGWPEAVASSESAVYVADVYNHQIVRLDKHYTVESATEIK
jgi:hypothetical protein